MSDETPRVNASLLEEFKSRPVRVVGQLSQYNGAYDGNVGVLDAAGSVVLKGVTVSVSTICIDLIRFHF